MKEIYFTLPYRRSKKTVRLEYGQVKKKFLCRTYDGEIIGRKTSEDSPKEEVFEGEQEMLKRVHDIKKGLMESRWVIQNKESISQPSFLKTEIIDGAISFEFSVDVDPKKLDERRTEIVPIDTNFSMEDMIAEEEVVLTITHQGYIKRTALNTYRTQRRGGRGVQGAMSKEEDFLEHLFIANTHNYMLFFTDKGKCYWLKVYDIPQGGRAARGRAVVNLIGCEPGERVEAFVSVKNFDDDHYIVMSTRNGIVKKTVLSAYGKPRKGGIYLSLIHI